MATIVDNPNTLGGTPTTVTEYTGNYGILRCELRRLLIGTTVYFWSRVTVNKAGNSMINPTLTVNGTHVEYGWSDGDNQTPGSIYCSKAVGISGYPAQVSSFSGNYGWGVGTFDSPVQVNFTSY